MKAILKVTTTKGGFPHPNTERNGIMVQTPCYITTTINNMDSSGLQFQIEAYNSIEDARAKNKANRIDGKQGVWNKINAVPFFVYSAQPVDDTKETEIFVSVETVQEFKPEDIENADTVRQGKTRDGKIIEIQRNDNPVTYTLTKVKTVPDAVDGMDVAENMLFYVANLLKDEMTVFYKDLVDSKAMKIEIVE